MVTEIDPTCALQGGDVTRDGKDKRGRFTRSHCRDGQVWGHQPATNRRSGFHRLALAPTNGRKGGHLRPFAAWPATGCRAPKAGTRRHAAGLPGFASKAVVRVLQRDGSSIDPSGNHALLEATTTADRLTRASIRCNLERRFLVHRPAGYGGSSEMRSPRWYRYRESTRRPTQSGRQALPLLPGQSPASQWRDW